MVLWGSGPLVQRWCAGPAVVGLCAGSGGRLGKSL